MKTIGNIYVITGVAVIGGALFGFDISSLSAQLGTQSYRCYFNQGPRGPPFSDDEECSGPNSVTQGGITSAMAGGSWLGALCSGFVSDRLGRKYAIMVGCIVWILGSIICAASQNIAMLVAGRVINGFSVGIESAQVPVYIAELSPPSKRARLIGCQQLSITIGILIMYYVSFGASYIGGARDESAFRLPWGIQALPAVILFALMFSVPESPRWYARKDRWEECHAVLTLVHGKGDPDHPFVSYELRDIKDMVEFEAHNHASYLQLFQPRYLNRTIIAAFMQIWSQLCGMNVMMYYIALLFSMTYDSGNANLVASSITYIINVVMTLPALAYGDRIGRRPLLLLGGVLMAFFMYTNAAILAVHGEVVPGGIDGVAAQSMRLDGAPARAFIACTYLFVASFAPTWGPVSWTYPPEVFPLFLRGKGVSLSTSSNWAFNTALGLFVPPALENIRWQTWLIFGVFNTVATIHVFFFFPETSGKSLEAISDIFEDPRGIPYIGTPAWTTSKSTAITRRAEAGDVEAVRAKMAEIDGADNERVDATGDGSPEPKA